MYFFHDHFKDIRVVDSFFSDGWLFSDTLRQNPWQKLRQKTEKQVEFVWNPDLLRVKLIYLGLGKAIQKSISKNDKTEKKKSYTE